MRLGKHNFTKTATIQVTAAAVLGVLGILLGLWAWADYSLYSNFTSAIRAQATGRLQDVFESLNAVSQRRADYPFPAELNAKLKVDGGSEGSLQEAFKLYKWLAEKGHGDRPTVRMGLAAAHVRLSDLAKSDADRLKAWTDAGKVLSGVTWPEAKIIQSHIFLRQGKVDEARTLLQGVFGDASGGKVLIGLDSLTDLYVGLGLCAAKKSQYLEASKMFSRANKVMPRARIPLLNTVYLLARQNIESPPPHDSLLVEYQGLVNKAQSVWKREFDRDPQTYRGLDHATFVYGISIAWALLLRNEGDPHAFIALESVGQFSDQPQFRAMKELTQAGIFITLLQRTGLSDGKRMEYLIKAERSLDAAIRISDNPKVRATAGLNVAALRGAITLMDGGRTSSRFAGAQEAFEKAAADNPDNAALHRSRGTFYMKTGQNDKEIAAFEKSLQLDDKGPGQDKVRQILDQLKSGGAGEKKP
jgi:tetratricopeptide (TPR) repeat protein